MKENYKTIDGRIILSILVIVACIAAFVAPYIL